MKEDNDENEPDWEEKLSFSEFDEFAQGDIMSAIEEDVRDYIFSGETLPDDKNKRQILKDICNNMAFGNGYCLIINDELSKLFDLILKKVVKDLENESDGNL